MMKKVDIQLIRNATLKLNYAGKTLLVDPMLSEKNSFMSFVQPDKNLNPTINLPVDAEEVIDGVDAVLLTHAHPDHLDQKAMEMLPKNITLFAQQADRESLKAAPFTNIDFIETEARYDDITIIRTDGKHGPDQILQYLGMVSGYILKAENYPTIYIVGDCLLDDGINRIIETYKPDIIITNSGGAIFMGENRILMNEEETVAIAKKAPNAKVIAVHMESLDHCTVTRESLQKVATEAGLEIITPADGEILKL
ncbi:MBL fold metallo-hydrolase [Prolixibacteraceae bacterium]|nr:MBL fold metallo-hydrolase [Prolixibacteraceae bacterium]